MADKVSEFEVKLKDNVTTGIEAMAKAFAAAAKKIRTEAQEQEKAAREAARKAKEMLEQQIEAMNQLGEKIKGVAGTFAGGFVGLTSFEGLVEGIKGAIEASAEMELTNKRLEGQLASFGVQTGKTIGDLKELADEVAKGTGLIDEEQVKKAESSLMKFDFINGETFDHAIKAAANFALVTGEDMASATDKIGKALSNPEKGLKALEKAVGKFTEEEKRSIETMISHNDLIGAQDEILHKLDSRFGAVTDSMANSAEANFKRLSNSIKKSTADSFSDVTNFLGNLAKTASDAMDRETAMTEFAKGPLADKAGFFGDKKTKDALESMARMYDRKGGELGELSWEEQQNLIEKKSSLQKAIPSLTDEELAKKIGAAQVMKKNGMKLESNYAKSLLLLSKILEGDKKAYEEAVAKSTQENFDTGNDKEPKKEKKTPEETEAEKQLKKILALLETGKTEMQKLEEEKGLFADFLFGGTGTPEQVDLAIQKLDQIQERENKIMTAREKWNLAGISAGKNLALGGAIGSIGNVSDPTPNFAETMQSAMTEVNKWAGPLENFYSAWSQLQNQQEQAAIDSINSQLAAQQNQYQKELALKKQLGMNTVQFEKDNAVKMADAKISAAAKESALKKKQYEADKAAHVAGVIMSGAQAAVGALTLVNPIAVVAMEAIIAATTAVQLAAVLSAPTPAFADGGMVLPNGDPMGRMIRVAETEPEWILNGKQMSSMLGGGRGGGNTVHVNVTGSIYGMGITDLAQEVNRQIRQLDRVGKLKP